MAAAETVSHFPQFHNSVVPRHLGVITLFGYGIQVRVDRGHLLIEDGIGADRCRYHLPRVGHGLKRLVVIGSDGMISLAALRWLADQDAAFVMLDRDGSVLATTGPVRPSDVRLRRSQAMALQTGAALQITRELISQKLVGQETVARGKLRDSKTADSIAKFRTAAASAETIEAICLLESLRPPLTGPLGATCRSASLKPICLGCPVIGLHLARVSPRCLDRLAWPLTLQMRS